VLSYVLQRGAIKPV